MRPRLKIFNGDDTPQFQDPQVSLSLSDFRQILDEASRWDRTWLRDWDSDTVKVSTDLYEILTAYSNIRPSA